MNFISRQIVFQEVPNEISLSYLISGCPLRCRGCHSADAWSPLRGQELSLDLLKKDLTKYREWITCVLFMGGEWEPDGLIERLKVVQSFGFKTALYTGLDEIPGNIQAHLNYLKLGPYVAELGGLSSARSNQRLINLKTNELMNHYFHKEEKNDTNEPRAN